MTTTWKDFCPKCQGWTATLYEPDYNDDPYCGLCGYLKPEAPNYMA